MADPDDIDLDYVKATFPELKELSLPQFEAYAAVARVRISSRDLRAEVKRYARALMVAHMKTIADQGAKGRVESATLGAGSKTYFPLPNEQTTYGEELSSLLRRYVTSVAFIS